MAKTDATQKVSAEVQDLLEATRTNLKIAVALDDMSATAISEKAIGSVNTLGKFLRGETQITFVNLCAVCALMGLPVSIIATRRPITPDRIRLARKLERLSDSEIEALLAAIN